MKRIYHYNNLLVAFLFCCTVAFTSSCDVEFPNSLSQSVEKVSELAYQQEGRDVMLKWQLPSNDDILSVIVEHNGERVVELPATATSWLVKRPKADVELAYTVKVAYANGIISEGQTVRFTVAGVPARIGYLISENSISEIQDDDEKAAAEWFVRNFAETGDILTPSDFDKLTPDDYSMVWIQIDRKFIGHGWRNLPQALVSDQAVAALQGYLREGGNLLLTKFATQLLVPVGRIPEAYAPGIFGDGDGGYGEDIWTMNAWLGNAMPVNYDRRDHQIFAGMEKGLYNGWTHETIPLEGPGEREDHNCMWDYNAYGFDGNPNVVVNFEQATNSTTLAVWGHVQDFCVGGIVDFNPTTEFAGRCLAIGLSAYEFNQNSNANIYQDNIEKLTANCINYLK